MGHACSLKSHPPAPRRATECSPWVCDWPSKCPGVLQCCGVGLHTWLPDQPSRVEPEMLWGREDERDEELGRRLPVHEEGEGQFASFLSLDPALCWHHKTAVGESLEGKGEGGFPSLPGENFDLHLFLLDWVGNWPKDALCFLGSFGSGKPEEVGVPHLVPIWCYGYNFVL